MNFEQLRAQHHKFVYHGFSHKYEDGDFKVKFDFEILPEIKFSPEVIFPKVSEARIKSLDPSELDGLIFNLGMVELLSYWKVACPPKILIKAGFLDNEQLVFWKNLLVQGLGEFLYQNKIDFTDENLVEFVIDNQAPQFAKSSTELKNRDLMLVGGGKDSAVALDILTKSEKEFGCLSLNPTAASKRLIELTGCQNSIFISRIIDPKLLELNKQGFLNGHTPFSAYLAFLSVIAGVLYDYKNLIVSNEASSNEGNVEWKGMEINHQYSKTIEFETLFRNYCQGFLSLYADYFSILRPLNELQIARIFSKLVQYHKDFRSCNKGSKTDSWCGNCPKCVSTYLTLYPFLEDKTQEIFGKDLLQDESLIPVVQGLLRMNDLVKPFECVCTTQEMQVAIFLSAKKYQDAGKSLPKVLEAVSQDALDPKVDYEALSRELLENWDEENYVPEAYSIKGKA